MDKLEECDMKVQDHFFKGKDVIENEEVDGVSGLKEQYLHEDDEGDWAGENSNQEGKVRIYANSGLIDFRESVDMIDFYACHEVNFVKSPNRNGSTNNLWKVTKDRNFTIMLQYMKLSQSLHILNIVIDHDYQSSSNQKDHNILASSNVGI